MGRLLSATYHLFFIFLLIIFLKSLFLSLLTFFLSLTGFSIISCWCKVNFSSFTFNNNTALTTNCISIKQNKQIVFTAPALLIVVCKVMIHLLTLETININCRQVKNSNSIIYCSISSIGKCFYYNK